MGSEHSRFVAFSDFQAASRRWEIRPACSHHRSPRRNARIHKILLHQFVECEYSIWLDGGVALRMPAEDLIGRWLGDADIAAFAHRRRADPYLEAEVCLQQGLDSTATIRAQMARYRALGMPESAGLAETNVVIRRHNRSTALFNTVWWGEVAAFSVRDQLSFNFAAWSLGMKINYITPTRFENSCFDDRPRPAQPEPTP